MKCEKCNREINFTNNPNHWYYYCDKCYSMYNANGKLQKFNFKHFNLIINSLIHQENFQKLGKELLELQSKKNDGRGISCVKTICDYLEMKDITKAAAVVANEFDKIRNYPEIMDFILKNIMLYFDTQVDFTKIYRVIIERSSMANNDEFVIYSCVPLDHQNKMFMPGMQTHYKIVMCREVRSYEIIDLDNSGKSTYKEKPEEITMILDAFTRLKEAFEGYSQFFNDEYKTPTKMISYYVGNHFYDCMSGGLPTYEISFLRYLCQNPLIDQNELCYVDEKSSIKNFLRETESAPKFEELREKYLKNNILISPNEIKMIE